LVKKVFFYSCYAQTLVQKDGMQKAVGKKKKKGAQTRWTQDGSPLYTKRKINSYDRVVCAEDRAKVDQILGEMEKSFDRIGRLLKVFDRMG
jgi:hypothetical protein